MKENENYFQVCTVQYSTEYEWVRKSLPTDMIDKKQQSTNLKGNECTENFDIYVFQHYRGQNIDWDKLINIYCNLHLLLVHFCMLYIHEYYNINI